MLRLWTFKAGKSSFLNSLLGQDVLPVGAIPVTTAITRLQYGNNERALVRHFDGRITEVPLIGIVKFTSEAENPGNSKNVAIVDIELPSLQKYPGMRLVDTPGLGSVYKYHQSASENWLPAVGTALLAVSADRPLSDMIWSLFANLQSHTEHHSSAHQGRYSFAGSATGSCLVFSADSSARTSPDTTGLSLFNQKQYQRI